MTRTLAILATLAVVLASPAKAGGCDYYCRKNGGTATVSTPAPGERRAITNTSRQRLGDIYNPGHGQRVQIRDTSRRILGYIEPDGTITNRNRQRIGTLD